MSNAILDDINKARVDLFNFWRCLNNSPGANDISTDAIEQVHDAYNHLVTAGLLFSEALFNAKGEGESES